MCNKREVWLPVVPEVWLPVLGLFLRNKVLGTNRQRSRRESPDLPTTVLFVPNSHDGLLLKRLQEKEPMLSRISGYKVRLVESSGTPLARLFSLDLSDGICHRINCVVCKSHNSKGSSKCRKNNVVYESYCKSCKTAGKPHSTYIGETGRSLFERSLEHLADAEAKKSSSHIFKHWALEHGSSLSQPEFHFKVLRVHKSCLERHC